MNKRKDDIEYQCFYNMGVDCNPKDIGKHCNKCGWSPEGHKLRLKRMEEKRACAKLLI